MSRPTTFAKVTKGFGLCAIFVATGCASAPADDTRCPYVKTTGMCAVDVALDPREADAPDEATTMEVTWTWEGQAGGEVLPRVVRYHLSFQEAAWRKASWEALARSRCVIEEPVAPCDAPRRIVFVEAEP